jgi:hypothetical protein
MHEEPKTYQSYYPRNEHRPAEARSSRYELRRMIAFLTIIPFAVDEAAALLLCVGVVGSVRVRHNEIAIIQKQRSVDSCTQVAYIP